MASSIRQELHALFLWHPPALVPARKQSISTRPPGFYDKHLSDNLILRRVRLLPSLIEDLVKNVDSALAAASETLPPVEHLLPTMYREKEVQHMIKSVTDEKGVADFYDKTTIKFCLPVASTLSLHPKAQFSEWDTLLAWSQSRTSGYAIADGQLLFSPDDADDAIKVRRERMVKSMDEETRRIFELLRVKDEPVPVSSWEMKSLATGSEEVMTAVPKLGEFTWTKCADAECLKSLAHQRQRDRVALAVIGPDAKAPPWNLKACLLSRKTEGMLLIIPQDNFSSSTTGTSDHQQQITTQSDITSASSTLPQTSQGHVSLTDQKGKGKASFTGSASDWVIIDVPLPVPLLASEPPRRMTTRSATQPTVASPSMPPPPLLRTRGPASLKKGKGPATKRRKVDYETYRDRDDLTAQSLVQQVAYNIINFL